MKGLSPREVAGQLSMDSSLADGMLTAGRVPSGVTDSWPPRTGYLTIAERGASSGTTRELVSRLLIESRLVTAFERVRCALRGDRRLVHHSPPYS